MTSLQKLLLAIPFALYIVIVGFITHSTITDGDVTALVPLFILLLFIIVGGPWLLAFIIYSLSRGRISTGWALIALHWAFLLFVSGYIAYGLLIRGGYL